MAIGDDFSISESGNIRYTGSGTNYTVIALHRWLGDLMDDAQASGNDILDITDATASERATDNLITLNAPYNIDDTAAQHLYDGSIVQDGGNTIYDGLVVIAAAGMYLEILQNEDLVSPNFWATGLNADAANGISHRFMVKVRSGGVDIDGRRIIGYTREHGFTYSEFRVNGTARGNNVLALNYTADLNNTTAIGTVAGWNTITNTEGYRLIDVDGSAPTENYYSEWNKAAFSINQLYERTKWLSRRGTTESSGVNTGTDYTVGNGTITGQAQSYTHGAKDAHIIKAFFRVKKSGSPTGNAVARVYAHTGTFGSSGTPNGATLATSLNLDVSTLTTSYAVKEFYFSTPFEAVAATNYFIAIEYSGGDVSNFIQVEGAASGGSAGNRAENTGAWAASAGSDLNYDFYTSPKLYGQPGALFRGITHQINAGQTAPSGSGLATAERVTWDSGNGAGYVLAYVDVSTAATTLSVNGSLQFTRPAGDFLTDGYRKGMHITTGAFTNAGNNTTKIIDTVTAGAITVTDTSGLVTETGSGDEVMGATHAWIQLTKGVAPTAGQVVTGGGGTITANTGTPVTERTISTPFIGVSTGSALIGSYGAGVEAADLSASDLLFDLSNTQRTPPNNVTFTVNGLVNTEDRVLVTRLGYLLAYTGESGGPFTDGETLTFGGGATAKLLLLVDEGTTGYMYIRLLTGSPPSDTESITGGTSSATATMDGDAAPSQDVEQYTLNGAHNSGTQTTITVNETIDSDTPQTTTIRVRRNSGIYSIESVTSWTGSVFTITSSNFATDPASANAGVYSTFIDKLATSTSESFTVVFSSVRNLFIRVRDGAGTPIKTFETTGTLTSAGGSTTAIRTTDT